MTLKCAQNKWLDSIMEANLHSFVEWYCLCQVLVEETLGYLGIFIGGKCTEYKPDNLLKNASKDLLRWQITNNIKTSISRMLLSSFFYHFKFSTNLLIRLTKRRRKKSGIKVWTVHLNTLLNNNLLTNSHVTPIN